MKSTVSVKSGFTLGELRSLVSDLLASVSDDARVTARVSMRGTLRELTFEEPEDTR